MSIPDEHPSQMSFGILSRRKKHQSGSITRFLRHGLRMIRKGVLSGIKNEYRLPARPASERPLGYLKDVRNGSSVVCFGYKYDHHRTDAFSSVKCYPKDICDMLSKRHPWRMFFGYTLFLNP